MPLQVLVFSLTETLTSDLFLGLVHQVQDEENRATLERLCGDFVNGWFSAIDEVPSFFESSEVGKRLQPPFAQFLQFCKCTCFLLRVKTAAQTNAADVTAITVNKAPDTFGKVLKSLLTSAEPEGPERNAIKAASRDFWMKEVSDAVKTAASETEHRPTHDKILADLGKLLQEQPVFSPGCCGPLDYVMEQLPKLKKLLRRNSTVELEQAARARVVQLAEALLSAESTPSISSADLSSLITSLAAFQSDSNCAVPSHQAS